MTFNRMYLRLRRIQETTGKSYGHLMNLAITILIPGSGAQFGGHFRTTCFSPFGPRRKILRIFGRLLAQNCGAHLSGWVRLRAKAMTWAFFAPELEKWVSGRVLENRHKIKFSESSLPIVGIVGVPQTKVFMLSRVS